MRYLIFFSGFLQIVLLQGCQEERLENNHTLTGTWIELSGLSDTLTFRENISDENRQYFMLSRGKELRNGHLLPKQGFGLYEFKIQGDSISVYNTLSSCYCFNSYYFNFDNHINVGEFYENDSTGKILTFVRIR